MIRSLKNGGGSMRRTFRDDEGRKLGQEKHGCGILVEG